MNESSMATSVNPYATPVAPVDDVGDRPSAETFFAGLGYRNCAPRDVPASIRASGEFLAPAAASAPVLCKRL